LEVLHALGRDLEAGGSDDKAPLLLTKDEPVLWVSQNRAELAGRFLLNLPDDATVRLLMNKRQFLARALAEGWPMPRTFLAASREELERLAPEIPFPCILKPELKNERFRRQPIPKTFRLEDREQLFAAYDRVAPFEAQVIVSEFVPGPDTRLLSCRTYWSTRGEPLANFAVQKLLQWPVEIGIMALAGPCPPELREGIVSLCERIFRSVGFRGLGALEVKLQPDGRPAITEPCVGRTVYSGEIAALNGIDLPAIAYHDMVFGRNVAPPEARRGAPLGPPVKLDDGSRSRRSGKVYRDRGLLHAQQVRALRSGPHRDMLWRVDDPGPGLATIRSSVKEALARPLRRVLRSAR
nr:hypothetical protein [Acidobacteriota bacterium]